ncbi:hypothetical protein SDC9_180057 [bioreactor metagenome]|uniref:Uncharacterized protein n=1 Tax=bioreactor metagenome TaxID=1076179 RepID=A0A645H0M0_9ZZZZ
MLIFYSGKEGVKIYGNDHDNRSLQRYGENIDNSGHNKGVKKETIQCFGFQDRTGLYRYQVYS